MRRWALVLLWVSLAVVPGVAWGQPAAGGRVTREDAELRTAREFATRVGAYVALQQSVVRAVSAEPTSTDAQTIAARRTSFGANLVKARPAASQGDIFTPEVATRFRRMVRKAFQGKEGRAMRRTIREGDHVRPVVLRVNDVYPESVPITTMPPTLLRVLPVLPPELAYRIVGSSLVLLDVRTNLIVDFVPGAIPGAR